MHGICDYDEETRYSIDQFKAENADSKYPAVDCGKNIELFKSLAAMNEENNREQWFVEEGKMFKCTSDKINNYPYNWPNTRKATAEEIVEYFKNKEL